MCPFPRRSRGKAGDGGNAALAIARKSWDEGFAFNSSGISKFDQPAAFAGRDVFIVTISSAAVG